ncbi:MAG: CoA-binding protein [Candidatus Lokiarchaeota archaeon]|nr:CoA-binding protein [Candidatus Harpocratesius repetitus]
MLNKFLCHNHFDYLFMTVPNHLSFLDAFFHSKSVAVFGASTNSQKSGYKIVENLMNHHYLGKIYPINPRGGTILGLPLYKSVLDVEDSIDLAIIFVPNVHVVQIVKDCIQKGVKGAIIEAAGFGEVGIKGKNLRDELRRVTENFAKIRILGPNCTGITAVEEDGVGFFSSFIPMAKTKAGSLAIVSQSGFINGAYYPDFTGRNPQLGLRYVVAIGNKLDINENHLLEYFLYDESVSTIGIYIESFKDVRKFISLTRRAHKNNKDVILLRSGFSPIGAKATTSHTGSLAENSSLIKAVIYQSGCILADDFWELFQICRTISFLKDTNTNSIKLPKAAIITISGAAGAIISDWCHRNELIIPEFDGERYARLKELYPPWMDPNPFALIDYWPAVEHLKSYEKVVISATDIALSSPDIQVVFLTVYYNSKSWVVDWNKLKTLIEKHKKPIFVWIFGDYQDILKAEMIFQKIKIPVFNSEKEIVQTFSKIYKSREFRAKLNSNF